MSHSYVVLGAGPLGLAAAYDLAANGEGGTVVIVDADPERAKGAVRRLRAMTGRRDKEAFQAVPLDARREAPLREVLRGARAMISALPYYHNPAAAKVAVQQRVHYVDLGGHMETTWEILKLDAQARKAGVALVPDCGLAPGLSNLMAASAISDLDKVKEVSIYCGSLPQIPTGPLGFKSVFSLEGLLSRYFGQAYILRKGKLQRVEAFGDLETVDFPEVGALEAFTTAGGASTCPWTYEGRVRDYAFKTLQHPGHHAKIDALRELGLFETRKVKVNGSSVVPRELFAKVAQPHLCYPEADDLVALRVVVRGQKDKDTCRGVFEVLEKNDKKTGLTATDRVAGATAGAVAHRLASGGITGRGAVRPENLDADGVLTDLARRGIKVKRTVETRHG